MIRSFFTGNFIPYDFKYLVHKWKSYPEIVAVKDNAYRCQIWENNFVSDEFDFNYLILVVRDLDNLTDEQAARYIEIIQSVYADIAYSGLRSKIPPPIQVALKDLKDEEVNS